MTDPLDLLGDPAKCDCGTVLHPGQVICRACGRDADEIIRRATGES